MPGLSRSSYPATPSARPSITAGPCGWRRERGRGHVSKGHPTPGHLPARGSPEVRDHDHEQHDRPDPDPQNPLSAAAHSDLSSGAVRELVPLRPDRELEPRLGSRARDGLCSRVLHEGHASPMPGGISARGAPPTPPRSLDGARRDLSGYEAQPQDLGSCDLICNFKPPLVAFSPSGQSA